MFTNLINIDKTILKGFDVAKDKVFILIKTHFTFYQGLLLSFLTNCRFVKEGSEKAGEKEIESII